MKIELNLFLCANLASRCLAEQPKDRSTAELLWEVYRKTRIPIALIEKQNSIAAQAEAKGEDPVFPETKVVELSKPEITALLEMLNKLIPKVPTAAMFWIGPLLDKFEQARDHPDRFADVAAIPEPPENGR